MMIIRCATPQVNKHHSSGGPAQPGAKDTALSNFARKMDAAAHSLGVPHAGFLSPSLLMRETNVLGLIVAIRRRRPGRECASLIW